MLLSFSLRRNQNKLLYHMVYHLYLLYMFKFHLNKKDLLFTIDNILKDERR